MTIFIDASALVAILAEEADWQDLADRLDTDTRCLSSAMAAREAVAALCRSYSYTVTRARAEVDHYLLMGKVAFVAIGAGEYEVAADAYARFGKGRHRAALNMGDCFAYACARTNDARLLFKGQDFAMTDIDAA